MKLTEQHVNDRWVDVAIAWAERSEHPWDRNLLIALLELKQRRAEDRQREYESNPSLDPCNQPENIR